MSLDDMMCFRLTYLKAIATGWSDPEALRALLESSHQWEALRKYGPLPSWDIDLHLRADTLPGNGYRRAVGGWVGKNFVLHLRLPEAPRDLDDKDQALALARYYEARPTPFGTPRRPHNGVGADGSAGNGMGHWTAALELGGVIARALALSWCDSTFREQLTQEDSLTALQNWLGYNTPWNMVMEVEQGAFGTYTKDGGWKDLPKNAITLFIPSRPEEERTFAVALAAYNQTGDAYPLTCP